MICPECGRSCFRDEVDVGVGIIASPWMCECGWDEDQSFPMTTEDWNNWLSDGPKPEQYQC